MLHMKFELNWHSHFRDVENDDKSLVRIFFSQSTNFQSYWDGSFCLELVLGSR